MCAIPDEQLACPCSYTLQHLPITFCGRALSLTDTPLRIHLDLLSLPSSHPRPPILAARRVDTFAHRPEFIHEYRITQDSLFAASSLGYSEATISERLRRMSKVWAHNSLCADSRVSCPKVELSKAVLEFIKKNTVNYGKAKLCLQNSKAFIECDEPVKDKFYKDAEMCKYIIPNTALEVGSPGTAGTAQAGARKWSFQINDQFLPVCHPAAS